MRLRFTSGLMAVLLMHGIAFANTPELPKKTVHAYVSHYENVLGTSMELKINAVSEKQSAIAEKAALKEIERLSAILSGYDTNSEFSKWMRTSQQPIHVSKDLFNVLSLFDQWRNKTSGALDASAEVVARLWKQAATNRKLPTQQAINAAVAEVKQTHWLLDATHQTATHLTNTPLRLNSFAKSYIIQSATKAAQAAAAIGGVLVNIGGDMVIAGEIAEPVMVSDPKADAENDLPIDRLRIQNMAVATSGNYRRGELINGQWYSHIVNPGTGQPAGNIISVTVIAPSATDAGALATAFNVMSPDASKVLAATMPGVEYLIITAKGERIESSNWKTLQIPAIASTNIDAEKEWKNELTITLELTQQQGYAKRPFAAVWVTDSEGNTVKNIALWYNKPRWIRDLKEWYRANGSTFTADATAFTAITGATRSAGKYTLKWDGRNDKGEILKSGKYTVHIEVVREHGGYDLLHQDINCNKKAQQFNLKGNVEIAAVSLDYAAKQ